MKFLKNTVAIVALLAIGSINTKQVGKATTKGYVAPVNPAPINRAPINSAPVNTPVTSNEQQSTIAANKVSGDINKQIGIINSAIEELMNIVNNLPKTIDIGRKMTLVNKVNTYYDELRAYILDKLGNLYTLNNTLNAEYNERFSKNQ